MLKLLQTKNSKKNWGFLLIGVTMASTALLPFQSAGAANTELPLPVMTHSAIYFTLPEDSSSRVLSGTNFGASHSGGEIISFSVNQSVYVKYFSVRNKNTVSTTGIQYAEITYLGYSFDYETATVFNDAHGNGRRGYEKEISACVGPRRTRQCSDTFIRVYVTDVPERNSMLGNVTVSSRIFVGDTITANFSGIRDEEGINNLSIAWSRAVCPSDSDSDVQGRWWPVRGVGRWSVRQRISSANNSESYQLTNSDINNRVKSVWGIYQTDTDHYKWVCKDIAYDDDDVIQTPTEPENRAPEVGYGPGYYYVNENSGSGTLSADSGGQTPDMFDMDRETITYSISVPEDTPSSVASTIRSTFRVRNTAPNPTADDSAQTISISYNRSFNYETAPDFDDGEKGYEFDVKGCDPDGACEFLEIRVYVVDVAETNTISGSISITGQPIVGQVLRADFSGITDTEGIDTGMNIVWQYGPCSSSRGTGDLPASYGSKNYVEIGNSTSYTIQPVDVVQTISVWGFYSTNTGSQKWVCRQISTIRGDTSLPTVSIRRLGRSSLPAKENAEFRLTRTNHNLSFSVTVRLQRDETWVENGEAKIYTGQSFTITIPANETQITFTSTLNKERTITVKILPDSGYGNYNYNVGSSSTATATFTAANISPTGKPVITGTPQVGQTLTADASSIMDGNGISRSFSYAWWKVIEYRIGGDSDILQQISGATRSTYTIRSEDVRSKIKVKVSYRDDNSFNHTLESNFTAKVTPASNANAYVAQISLRNSSGGFVDLGSHFKVSPGDRFAIIVYMSQEVSGLSAQTGEVYMRLNIGGQTRTIDRSPITGEDTPQRLIFHYTVEEGVSGRVTFPRNGLFIGNGYDEHTTVVSNPSAVGINVNLNYPQTQLGDMDIVLSANFQNMPEAHNGSSFTFRLNFDEPLRQVSQQAVRNAFTVTNGTISGLQKVDDSNWDVTINPNSVEADLTISFIHQKRCGQSSALCTSNGHVVDSVLSASVLGSVVMSIEDVSVSERTGSMTFDVVLDEPYIEEINVDWATSDQTATAGSDYTSGSGTLTFAVGDTRKTITVAINNDALLSEANETFQVTLSNLRPTGKVQFGKATATGTIINASTILASIEDASADEEAGPMTFNVVLDKPYTEEINIDWETTDDRAGTLGDYTSSSGTLTFAVGDTSKTFTVALVDDNTWEADEPFDVHLSNPRPAGKVWFTRRLATGIITDESDNPGRSVNPEDPPPKKPEKPEPPPVIPITASFLNMPSEHDGTNTFTFELRFSEDVTGLSYRTLKGSAFQVTNGSIKNARRLSRPANQRWEITVTPSNNNNISISLPSTTNCSASGAICHSDGRKLSNGRSSLVQGPVGISVADASANENTDSTIDFTVSLSRSSTRTITVNYATQNGSATAGQDYTSKSGTLTFAANETSKTVSVSLLSDIIDEGNETFTLRLSSPSNAVLADGTATGTIENSDPMPKAWLSRFGRTVGSQAVDAISSRMGAPTKNRVVVGGVEMSMTEETKGASQWDDLHKQFKSLDDQADSNSNNQTMTLKELIHGTSFNLSGKNESTGRTWSAWGQFASDTFKGKEGDLNLEGKVNTGFLGVDSASGNWRGGVAVSTSEGEGTFHSLKNDSVGNEGEVESSLTSVYTYAGHEFGENKSIWGILGIGEGDVTLTQENLFTKADTSMYMGAVGAKGSILSQSEGDGMDMTLQADGMWVQMSSEKTTEIVSSKSDVTLLRLTLDSSKNFKVGEGVLTPSFQMGVRHDGGDAEEGMGLEAGGAFRYVAGGIALEGSLRKLLAHESDHEEWGASVALLVDPGQSGRGLNLSVLPTWGEPSSGVSNLLSVEGPRQIGSNGFKAENRLEAEIGYGISNPFKKLLGVLTPYFGLSMGDNNRVTKTGARWEISHNANLGLELNRTKGESKESDDKAIMLQGGFQW